MIYIMYVIQYAFVIQRDAAMMIQSRPTRKSNLRLAGQGQADMYAVSANVRH